MTEPTTGQILIAGALEVVPAAYTARAGGQVVKLTPREFEVLLELMRRRDLVVSRSELYRLCWGGELESSDRAVDVYVLKLRRKLAQVLPSWAFIHTHWRLGYRFSPVPDQAPRAV